MVEPAQLMERDAASQSLGRLPQQVKGETDYLVMEPLEGETLAHRLDKELLPVAG
jgi:hypothetical protein